MSGRLITCVEVLLDLWIEVRCDSNHDVPGPMGATDVPKLVETLTCSTVVVPSILLM
jgi:hypothetical protein